MLLKRLRKLKHLFFPPVRGIPREEAMKIFKRDHYKCQYCGMDGLARFENWLVLSIDHVHPQAAGGPRRLDNLVTACQPCNVIKGTRVFSSREEARKYVQAKREGWRHRYLDQVKTVKLPAPSH
jgi:5-methylcytosine-specific restriction endonuclease McrA